MLYIYSNNIDELVIWLAGNVKFENPPLRNVESLFLCNKSRFSI